MTKVQIRKLNSKNKKEDAIQADLRFSTVLQNIFVCYMLICCIGYLITMIEIDERPDTQI